MHELHFVHMGYIFREICITPFSSDIVSPESTIILSIQGVTKKKQDCINHAVGTMPIGKPLAHRETQLLSSIVSQFL